MFEPLWVALGLRFCQVESHALLRIESQFPAKLASVGIGPPPFFKLPVFLGAIFLIEAYVKVWVASIVIVFFFELHHPHISKVHGSHCVF